LTLPKGRLDPGRAAPRETYWTDFWSAADDDEVFDVAFPVR
jgi:hypothetical protein